MNDLLETLFSAWGDPSPEGRAEKSDAAITPDFYYVDPSCSEPIRGRDDYLAHIAQFGEIMPGASAAVVAVSAHNGHARVTVDFVKDGNRMMRGQYFAGLRDGKIAGLIGFPGTGEPD